MHEHTDNIKIVNSQELDEWRNKYRGQTQVAMKGPAKSWMRYSDGTPVKTINYGWQLLYDPANKIHIEHEERK